MYQGRCIDLWGYAKEPFLRETHLCCEGRFHNIKIEVFREPLRGVLGTIQVTKVNSKNLERELLEKLLNLETVFLNSNQNRALVERYCMWSLCL